MEKQKGKEPFLVLQAELGPSLWSPIDAMDRT